MRMFTFSKIILTLALTGMLLVVSPIGQVQACAVPPPQPPDIWILFHGDGTAWIIFHGYSTFGAGPGQFCACAFNQIPEITAVLAAQIVDNATQQPIAGFNFQPNVTTSASFNGLDPGNWAGFSSDVSQAIPPGLSVDVQFLVELAPGVIDSALVNALEDAGGNVVGTDEADNMGNSTGAHLGLFPPGSVMKVIPTVSEWGLIVMMLLLLTAGTIIFGRVRQRRPVAL